MDDLNILKYTVRGLNHRYSAMKKINLLLGETADSHKFLDNSLAIVMDLADSPAGIIILCDSHMIALKKVFRAEIAFEKEENLKKTIESLPMIINNVRFEEDYKPEIDLDYRKLISDELGGINNFVRIPLRFKNQITGIMELYNLPHELGEDKKEALMSIGSQLAIAIDLFNKIDIMQNQINSFRRLSTVTETINYANELDKTLDCLIKDSDKFFDTDATFVLLLNSAGKLEYTALSGDRVKELKGTVIEEEKGLAFDVLKTRRSSLIENVSQNDKYVKKYESVFNMVSGSIITVALKTGDDIIGIYQLIRTQDKEPFSQEDLKMADILAAHASVSIDKARLIERKERWFRSTVALITDIIATKDELYPAQHNLIKELVSGLGRAFELSDEVIDILCLAASIQDIGKVVISEQILMKESELSEDDWNIIREHPVKCVSILSEVPEFEEIIPVIKHHHEKYDGTGYPDGLKGDEIPFLARLMSVVDSYVAMISPRPYRPAKTSEEAVSLLLEQKGMQFDPEIVDKFLILLEKR